MKRTYTLHFSVNDMKAPPPELICVEDYLEKNGKIDKELKRIFDKVEFEPPTRLINKILETLK